MFMAAASSDLSDIDKLEETIRNYAEKPTIKWYVNV
jgi:hypothetical protein